ncbi:hypothetical protein [Cohnella sp. GCM10027633]|uniref:hypothetical protein n=1 Tax=unclassified Cohnella TaxID=2636738 RepID=UPI003631C949
MSNEAAEGARTITLSDDIFRQPGLDIYSQMVYIILRSTSTDSNIPELSTIAKLGRMSDKQAVKALQHLAELKIVSAKLFRRMVGDFHDDRLSWAAKGLYAYCKNNPHISWHDLLELAGQSGEDEHRVRAALKELNKHGYLDEYPEWRHLAN